MAHGGHAGGHAHVHHHYTKTNGGHNSSGDSDFLDIFAIAVLTIIMAILICIGLTEKPLGNKEPITGTYEEYPEYVTDEKDYLTDHESIISGLKYLYDKTNIQMVVLVSYENWSDKKAVERYYEFFSDEAHVLLIVPTSWLSGEKYYAIGDIADPVIGDEQMSYLIKKLGSSKNGEKWEQVLTDFADMLISD
jgi:hypothetical protein